MPLPYGGSWGQSYAGLEHPSGYCAHRNCCFGTIGGRVEMAARHSTSKRKPTRRWVAQVTTDSTHPPAGLFTKDAATIARTLASPKVSPKGAGSGMRMLTYFMNRGGKNLTATRRHELEKAKKLLSERRARQKSSKAA